MTIQKRLTRKQWEDWSLSALTDMNAKLQSANEPTFGQRFLNDNFPGVAHPELEVVGVREAGDLIRNEYVEPYEQ